MNPEDLNAPVPGLLPGDPHDEKLLRNVHPPGWKNPIPAHRYDLVIIGAGTAGLVAAAGAAGLGARVALIERQLMGGDCLNSGCVPSKTLIRSATAIAAARDTHRLGVRAPSPAETDFHAVMERVRAIRARISHNDSAHRFRDELGVDVFIGHGTFLDSRRIGVDGASLSFRKAVVATGTSPLVPKIEGLDRIGYRTHETLFSLPSLPQRLGVLGAGPIGCEMAQAFQRLGSRVTVIERADQVLPREDPDVAELVETSLSAEGVDVRLGTSLLAVGERAGEKTLTLDSGGHAENLVVDEIVVATGRTPNLAGLGLEEAGIEHSTQGLLVDDRLRTTNPRVFAAGDICLDTHFTHAADFSARTVIQNALFFGRKKRSSLTIPWCTYTDPEVARVGLGAREAESRGIAIDTFVRHFEDVDRAIADGEETGFVRIHTEHGRDRILGATIVGHRASEMIGEIVLAMDAGIGLGRLASVIHPYPTRSEAIRQCGDAYNRTRLTPRTRRLFEIVLAWLR